MSDNNVPAELLEVREKIDAIDERLLDLLAQRFELTKRTCNAEQEREKTYIE